MNPSRHARKLACDLINEQFGELVQRVCDCLVNRGKLLLSQSDILRITGLPQQQLRNCLALLIQHNCVQAVRVENEDELHYTAILDNILHRMRLPKFLTVFSGFGKEAEELASTLFQHGRLNWENLLKHVAEGRANAAEGEMSLKETFLALVRAQFIEPCPVDEPTSNTKSMDEPAAKKLRTTQEGESSATEREEREEQPVLPDPSLLDAETFQMPMDLEGLVMEEAGSEEPSAGLKRKREEVPEEVAPKTRAEEAFDNNKALLWRLNYEQILRCLRNQICVKVISTRCYFAAGAIVGCMLERESDIWKPNEVAEAVAATEGGRIFKLDNIEGNLQHLKALGYAHSLDEGYKINTKNVIDCARRLEVEEVVLHKYGRKCYTLLRLLFKGGALHHKQLSERSFVSVKEAWELLHLLAKKNYVELDVHTSLVWRVKLDKLCLHLVNEMYYGMCILRPKLFEQPPEQQDQQEQGRSSQVLRNSLKRLDEIILLFHDFSCL